MQTARKFLSSLFLIVAPIAAESAHAPLPHGEPVRLEEFVEEHHGRSTPASA